MSDQVGNVIYAPSGVTVSPVTTDVELLNSTGAGWTQAGVTLKPGQGVLAVGTPLVKDSSTSMYVKAAATATTIEGFLRLAVDTGASGDLAKLGNLLRSGDAKYSVIKAANDNTDLTAGAIASVNGRLDAVRDSFIF
jgi:hypothetical protein